MSKIDPVIQDFLNRIAALRPRIEKIILFGSRARGDDKPYSDYDILLVVPERKQDLVDHLYDAVVDVCISTGRLISLKIFARDQFERLAAIPTPFMRNVLNEGIPLG
jgi:predicted nucleotidyltransferase